MKKNILSLIILLFLANIVLSQSNVKEENAIKVVSLSVSAWQSSSPSAVIPMQKIYNSETKELEGQYFYDLGTFNLFKVSLIKTNQKIDSVFIESDYKSPVQLSWDNDRVSDIKVSGFSNYTFKVVYDESGRITGYRCNDLFQQGKKARYINIEYENDRISKMQAIMHKPSDEFTKGLISASNSYTYLDSQIDISWVVYQRDKPNNPKFIMNQDSAKFIYDISKKSFSYKGLKRIDSKRFNDKNQIIFKEDGQGVFVKATTFEYFENRIFKDIIISKKNGNFDEKTIRVNFTRTDLPNDLPEYERIEGIYRFDVNDELKWIQQNGKYKQRVNGVWSDWQFMQY